MSHPNKPYTQADRNRDKVKNQQQAILSKKEALLNKLSDEEVKAELKDKGLPTFGTKQERLDRLKKSYGIQVANNPQSNKEIDIPVENKAEPVPAKKKKDQVVQQIEKINREREERRAN